jgi:hypothetical protein
MTKRSVVICVALLVLWTCPATGQDSLGVRTSLVINEIMADTRDNRCPWIELYNPTGEELELTEFFFRLGESASVRVASHPNRLIPNDYFVTCFQYGSCGGCGAAETPNENPVTVPERFVERWSLSTGEVLLGHDSGDAHGPGMVPVDYLAWGRGGQAWSQPLRTLLWSESQFVKLADHYSRHSSAAFPSEGSSIGRYPGSTVNTPDEWAIFDDREESRGGKNPVPSPKGFTLPDEATVASQSVAFSWRSYKGDDEYHLKVYDQREPNVAIIDRVLTTPIVRVGTALPAGRYRYEVQAFSNGKASIFSGARHLVVVETECDWPLPSQNTESVMAAVQFSWFPEPVCGLTSICKRIQSIRFSFQRKDTYLRCKTGGCDSESEEPCYDHAPQPHCISYVEPGTGVAPILCSGPENSSTCLRLSTNKRMAAGITVPFGPLATSPASITWGTNEQKCRHGSQYCLMASLSMMASAYGSCLSQDRVAYQICQIKGDHRCKALMHERTVAKLHAGEALKWALWIPDDLFDIDPVAFSNFGSFIYLSDFVAAQFTPQEDPIINFMMLRRWIDEGRPVMALGGSHYHVVAGYCRDKAAREWVLQLDPWTGPTTTQFKDWILSVGTLPDLFPDEEPSEQGVWVGPPIYSWTGVEIDEATVWNDADGDGSRDMDEARFGSDPTDPLDF